MFQKNLFTASGYASLKCDYNSVVILILCFRASQYKSNETPT